MFIRAMNRPGEGFAKFTIFSRETVKTASGRVAKAKLTEQGSFYGAVTQTSPTETDQHKQLGSPTSYTIVQIYPATRAKATDVLKCEDGRQFLVKRDPKNPGGLGHVLVYRVEERDDLEEGDDVNGD